MSDYPPHGAQCAIHPDRPASNLCTRCGNFMCDECGEGRTASLCPNCRALTGQGEAFPFSRDNWNFGALWDFCWTAFKRDWVVLSVGVVVLGAISGLTSALSEGFQGAFEKAGWVVTVLVAVVTTVAAGMVQGVVQMGLTRIVFDVLSGKRADFARLTSQLPKFSKFAIQVLLTGAAFGLPVVLYFGLLAALVMGFSGGESDLEALVKDPAALIFFGLGTMLALVPLVYFTLPLTFAARELVLDDEVGPWEAVTRSFTIAGGQRLSILGIGMVEALLAVAGVLACCVGVIPAAALGQLLMSGLYLALRNGSGLPVPGQGFRAPGARNI